MLDLQLGVDLGTAYSKLALRVYGQRGGDRSYLLDPDGDPLIPSVVAWDANTIHFGRDATARASQPGFKALISPKVAFAYPSSYQWEGLRLPDLLSIDDVMILLLAYLLQWGHDFATRFAREEGHAEMRMGLTVGVPTAHLDSHDLTQRYMGVVRAAFELYRQFRAGELPPLARGNALRQVATWCKAAKASASARPRGAVSEWLRSEASAGLLATFHSPKTEPKKAYLELDVGAGTCSASSFIIDDEHVGGRWQKAKIGFYGAWCEPPGADYLTAAATGRKGQLGVDARGDESAEASLGWSQATAGLHGPAMEFAQLAFRGLSHAYGRAHERLRGYSVENMGIFLVGGGARPKQLRAQWSRGLWRRGCPTLLDIDIPRDLQLFGNRRISNELADRCLVAYGLSHLDEEVPLCETPGQFFVADPDVGRRLRETLEGMYEK